MTHETIKRVSVLNLKSYGTNENRVMSKILGNTGMVAKATKFLYLEDES